MNRLGYLIKSGFTGIFSHGLMSFATVTIIMACLIIMGSFGLLVVNINDMLAGMEGENEVVAFVDDALTLEEAEALQPIIEAVPNVASVEFITNEQAMEEFKEDYDPELFDILDASTFRHRYFIHPPYISLMNKTKTDLEAVDGTAKVNAHPAYAQPSISATNYVSQLATLPNEAPTIRSFFIMSNTIKLATFTRREEIAIMKMVGASNGFIRCPFIVEGLVLGVLGGGLAFLIEWGLYNLVTGKIVTGVAGTLISVVPFSEVMLPLLGAYLAVGVLVGVVGGSSAIRNYLKV